MNKKQFVKKQRKQEQKEEIKLTRCQTGRNSSQRVDSVSTRQKSNRRASLGKISEEKKKEDNPYKYADVLLQKGSCIRKELKRGRRIRNRESWKNALLDLSSSM